MSIKHFCDQCGTEITADKRPHFGSNNGRLVASVGHLKVEVIQYQNGVANAGDYCVHCILDALYNLDDRPTVLPANV